MITIGIYGDNFPEGYWDNEIKEINLDQLRYTVRPPEKFRLYKIYDLREDLEKGPELNAIMMFNCSVKEAKYDVVQNVGTVIANITEYYQGNIKYIRNNLNLFDYVFSQYRELSDIGDCYRWIPFISCFIEENDFGIHKKLENISMISSRKNSTAGHNLRHAVISKFRNRIECIKYGGRYGKKIEWMKDFRYHVVIENNMLSDYFSEKLIDCFVTGCVPIYWGCPDIGRFFDDTGILTFRNLNELDDILNPDLLNEEDYNNRLSAINNNYNIATSTYLHEWEHWWNAGIKEMV